MSGMHQVIFGKRKKVSADMVYFNGHVVYVGRSADASGEKRVACKHHARQHQPHGLRSVTGQHNASTLHLPDFNGIVLMQLLCWQRVDAGNSGKYLRIIFFDHIRQSVRMIIMIMGDEYAA